MDDLPLPPRPPSRGASNRRRSPIDRGMTEDEIMRDRSGLSPLAREPMMRSDDRGYVVGGKQMIDPANFEASFRMKEDARKGTRMKSGGRVRGYGCAIKGKTKGRIV